MKANEDNSEWTDFEIIYKFDLGGSTPNWVNNSSHKHEVKRLKKFKARMELNPKQ